VKSLNAHLPSLRKSHVRLGRASQRGYDAPVESGKDPLAGWPRRTLRCKRDKTVFHLTERTPEAKPTA